MSFSDPLKVKVDGSTEKELSRISVGDLKSVYANEDSSIQAVISTIVGRRRRHTGRLNLSKVAPSLLNPAQNEEQSCSAYLVVDAPRSGYSNEELRKLVEGLKTLFTEANIKKLLGSES